MKKRLLAALMAGAMALTMTACGGSSDDSNAASGSDSGSAGSYKVGIVQLVQHEALDAATQGFQDKLKELVEADGGEVKFDSQNASGESANCTTIVNGFVSAGVDLIMANATAALQAAQAGTSDIPILGTSVTDYGTALGVSDWTGQDRHQHLRHHRPCTARRSGRHAQGAVPGCQERRSAVLLR